MSAYAAGRRAPPSESAYDMMRFAAEPEPSPPSRGSVTAPWGVDEQGPIAGAGRDARRPRGLTAEEKAALEDRISAKSSPASALRRAHEGGSFGGFGVDISEPVVSTGLGRRVKGATAEELSVFEAKVDQALAAHATVRPPTASRSRGDAGFDDSPFGAPASTGRRTKGMTAEEVAAAHDRAPKPTPGDIRAKMASGNWSGPTKVGPGSGDRVELSVTQENALRVTEAQGSGIRVSTLKGRAEADREAYADKGPAVTSHDIRAKLSATQWSHTTEEPHVYEPAPAAPKLSRTDESLSAQASHAAVSARERRAAHMTSSSYLSLDPTPPPMSGRRIVPPPRVPTHPYGAPEEDEPITARERHQRAMQSSWAPVPVDNGYRKHRPAVTSDVSAKQRFYVAQQGSIVLG